MKRVDLRHSHAFECTMAEWCSLPATPDRAVQHHVSRKEENGRFYVVRVEHEFHWADGSRLPRRRRPLSGAVEARMSQRVVTVEGVYGRAGYFNAGIVLDGDICSRAAPILHICQGKTAQWCSEYFRFKGWRATQRDLFAPEAA